MSYYSVGSTSINCLCVCHISAGAVWSINNCTCACPKVPYTPPMPSMVSISTPPQIPSKFPMFDNKIPEDIKRLFEEVRDIRELRYTDHQAIGCLEARLEEQLNKLAEFSITLNKMRSECHEILKQTRNPVPHTCPICKGEGFKDISSDVALKILEKHNIEALLCLTCKGEGILWK